jgi:hypothetical protein
MLVIMLLMALIWVIDDEESLYWEMELWQSELG